MARFAGGQHIEGAVIRQVNDVAPGRGGTDPEGQLQASGEAQGQLSAQEGYPKNTPGKTAPVQNSVAPDKSCPLKRQYNRFTIKLA